MAYDVQQLLKMSQAELDTLFTNSSPGPIPDGEARGTAIVAPGTTYSMDIAGAINHFAWQGKTFDAKNGVLRNRITSLGLNAIIAKVYEGQSWLDNKPCIVLDYSKSSKLAGRVRDEIREVAPGHYLGVVYLGARRTRVYFFLDFE